MLLFFKNDGNIPCSKLQRGPYQFQLNPRYFLCDNIETRTSISRIRELKVIYAT